MSLAVLALWFVCGLGTAILVAAARPSRAGAALGVLAFAVGAWWARQPFAPSAATVATGTALIAIWQIVRSPRRPYAAVMAGLLAGIWTAVLESQGLPLLAAIPVAALLPIASAWLRARRPAFAPPALVEEALSLLALVSIAAAALPGMADGWQAAVNLSARGGPSANAASAPGLPVWTLAVASAALVSGGLFSIWSRR